MRTVKKPASQSKFMCPAHQVACPNYSKYATMFAEEVLKIDSTAAIVWDWHCVPENTFMSIDATVVHGHKCTRFELDGPQHFAEKECKRSSVDEKKDMILMKSGWDLLRLHHRDKDEWHQYIKRRMHGNADQVVCTASYKTYMAGDHGDPVVVKASEL